MDPQSPRAGSSQEREFEPTQVARRPSSPDRDYYEQASDRVGTHRACLSIACKLLKRSHHTLCDFGEEALQPA